VVLELHNEEMIGTTCSILTRICCVESLSLIVTVRSLAVSKSIVTSKGIPNSSDLAYLLPKAAEEASTLAEILLLDNNLDNSNEKGSKLLVLK